MIEVIKKAIEKAVGTKVDFDVSASEKEEFGHYSTNLAFKLSSRTSRTGSGLRGRGQVARTRADLADKTPFEIAKELVERLKVKGERYFSRIEAVPPGFVNFWLKAEVLQKEVQKILREKNKYGQLKVKSEKLKVNLEFVSANPTGPLTMANGRGGFYGDVLANVLENAGHKVTREYYVNDTGNQIKLLGESILAAEGRIPQKEEYYKGGYIKKLKGKSAKQAAAVLLKEIKKSLKSAGIKHDVWFSEDKNLHKKSELKKALAFLEKRGLVKKKEGALWLSDAVLIKSDGNPTYFLADLAYHYDKFLKRKFDLAIDIWGADHHGYKARMENGIRALGVGPERLKILITQLVRLVSGGKEVRMSKRTGEFITLDELIQEVGLDAARFFFLMHSLDTHMDFDLDLAKERSQKNPVYYVQYAFVRAINILAKSEKRKAKNVDLRLLKSDSEIKLMLELVKLPDVLAQTTEDYQVHRLTKYAGELARALHNFYEKERVIGPVRSSPPMGPSDRASPVRGREGSQSAPASNGASAGAASNGMAAELQNARLALVLATKIVLENLFEVLGISKPTRM